jgi:hypothetical protein
VVCWGATANLKRAPCWAGDGIAACPDITRTRFGWINFLDLLRARHTDYVINEAALDDMRGPALAGVVIHPPYASNRLIAAARWSLRQQDSGFAL